MRGCSSSPSSRRALVLLAVAALMILALPMAGCDVLGDGDETTSTAASDGTSPDGPGNGSTDGQTGPTTTVASDGSGDTISLRVYFARDEKMAAATRVVPMTVQTGAAAMNALLQGPTAEETTAGMFSAIPAGTSFLGLEISGGVATVDLSPTFASGGGSLSMFTRLAQVVFTLTQFPSVDSVRFKLDGALVDTLGGEGIMIDEPLTREDLESMSPAILVESPTVGATVESPMRITGTANVFEAVFQVNIVDWDGRIVAEKMVMATSGSGTRGTFDVTVPFTVDREALGALIVFTESPMDGSQQDVVEIPLRLTM